MIEAVHAPPRIRGIKEAIYELKQFDSVMELTEKGLRRLVITGEIPSIQIGTKYLINMDVLIDFLYDSIGEAELTASGNIRKIKE